ncbi:MAG: hypothetical protein AB7G13_21670 [Lautropia sp.]
MSRASTHRAAARVRFAAARTRRAVAGAALGAGLALGLAALAPNAAAAELNDDLRVSYTSWRLGVDGVRQESTHAERLHRRPGAIWIAREIPPAVERLHDTHRHAHNGPGHSHAEVAGAPLWIRRDVGGALDVRLVDAHERRLIRIDPPHYGNVGFSGDWMEARHLVDPALLSKLQAVGEPVDGVQRYQTTRGHRTIRIRWDVAGRFAREIDVRDDRGLGGQSVRAEPIPAPQPSPFEQTEGYRDRDYSDLLD